MNEMINIKFNLLGQDTIYPVTISKSGSVIDLITACGRACNIDPDILNIKNMEKNFVRNADLKFYDVKEGCRIVGATKYVFTKNPNVEQPNISSSSDDEEMYSNNSYDEEDEENASNDEDDMIKDDDDSDDSPEPRKGKKKRAE